MLYLIGSQAMKLHGFDVSPKDWDFIATRNKKLEDLPYRCEIYDSDILYNKEVCHHYAYENITLDGTKCCLLSVKGLAVLKRSHLHRPLDFQKHIRHYQMLKDRMKEVCGSFNSVDLDFIKKRTKLIKKEFKDRTPKLNKSNDDFFNDHVKKIYIHDDLHKIVAYYNEPIYERLKINKDKAFCEKDLWDTLSYDDKVKCVQEECFVIALERKIIPELLKNNRSYPDRFAFEYALERVCTTLTSGWFRDFAIDNWKEINNYYVNFVERFKNARFPKK